MAAKCREQVRASARAARTNVGPKLSPAGLGAQYKHSAAPAFSPPQGTRTQDRYAVLCKRDSQPVFEKLADIFVSFQNWEFPARPSSEASKTESLPHFVPHWQTSEPRRLEPAPASLPISAVTTVNTITTIICTMLHHQLCGVACSLSCLTFHNAHCRTENRSLRMIAVHTTKPKDT